MSGKTTPVIQPAAAGPLTADLAVPPSIAVVKSAGGSGAPINQEDAATPLHNGDVGGTQSSEDAEDAVMADTQGSL